MRGLASVWAIGLLILCTCSSPTSDEEAIHELVREGARLAEEHDVKGIMNLVTEDFTVEPMGQDRQEIRRAILWVFMRYGDFKVLHPRPDVALESTSPGEAQVRVPFMIVRKERSFSGLKELYENPKDWLQQVGDQADLYRLRLGLIKKNDQWLVRSAHLEGFTGLGFEDY